MSQTIQFKRRLTNKPKRFQEFVFVSDSAMKRAVGSAVPSQLAYGQTDLERAEIGKVVSIEQIHAPRNVIRQLKSCGLKTGKEVRLLNRTDNGSVIVGDDSTSVGISKEIAQKIVVTLIGKE